MKLRAIDQSRYNNHYENKYKFITSLKEPSANETILVHNVNLNLTYLVDRKTVFNSMAIILI